MFLVKHIVAGIREVSKGGLGGLPLAHDFALQSLVCYTFCDRCCRKGDAALLSIPFPVTAEQADFVSFGTGNLWIRLREIRLFGCRW